MQGLNDMLNSAADLVWYNSMRGYISTRIDYFLEHTLSGTLTIVGAIALTLFTLWIMIQGYMIATGRTQDGLKGFILNALKSYLIIFVATGMAASAGFSVRTLTDDLMSSVAEVVAGDEDIAKCLKQDAAFFGCKIDRNLQVMQAAMSFVGQLDTADDPMLEEKKTRASYFVGIGTGAPALIAGTMLLMYKVAIALFISFGPIFIICLLFKATRPLFQKWLYYGIGTILSAAVLAVMVDISLDLIKNVAGALFVTSIFGANAQGLMQAATQQLGLGLMLSTLLISVPPMVAQFFNGVMGSFSAYNQLGGSPAPTSTAGLSGGMGMNGSAGANGASGANSTAASSQAESMPTVRHSTGQTASNYSADVVKSSEQSQTGNAARAYTPSPETPPPVSPDVRPAASTAPPKES